MMKSGSSPISSTYPYDCQGIVKTVIIVEPVMCSANIHWSWSSGAGKCDASIKAHYTTNHMYECIEDDIPAGEYDIPEPVGGNPGDPSNPSGGSSGNQNGGGTPVDFVYDDSITTPVRNLPFTPVDDCNTSKEDLKKVFPNTSDNILEKIANAINEYGQEFGIDTKEKLQHFLAQAGHESDNFGNFEENLNYRVNKLGKDYWNKYFNPIETPTADSNKANPNAYASTTNGTFVNNEMFANYVYDDTNRGASSKLGNVNIGDGYKYRGRGIIQLTGRSNYTAFNTFYQENYDTSVDLVNNPELLASDMKIAVISALWFFKNNVMDKISGGIDENTTVKNVTKLVNGGNTGLKHRKELHESAEDNIDCL